MPIKPTTESAIDFGSLYDEDWKKAQSRYDNYVRMSYTKPEQDFIGNIGKRIKRMGGTQFEVDAAIAQATQQVEAGKAKEADQLYLMPLRKKWEIIQSNPAGFQTQSKIDRISSDFDAATKDVVNSALASDEPIESTVSKRFQPLTQRWTVEAAKPEMSTEQQFMVRDLSQEINRLKSKRGTYTRELTNMQLDPQSRQAKAAAVADINSQLEDLSAQYQQALRGGTKEAEPAPVQTPFQASGFTALRQPDNIVGYTGDIADYVAPTEAQPAAPAAPTPRQVRFISGRPDLSNVSREEADAAWAARFNRPQRSTPVDREQVESPSEKSYDSAAQVKADFKAGNISRQKAVQILKDKFGLE